MRRPGRWREYSRGSGAFDEVVECGVSHKTYNAMSSLAFKLAAARVRFSGRGANPHSIPRREHDPWRAPACQGAGRGAEAAGEACHTRKKKQKTHPPPLPATTSPQKNTHARQASAAVPPLTPHAVAVCILLQAYLCKDGGPVHLVSVV
jgi:hypothetical protein